MLLAVPVAVLSYAAFPADPRPVRGAPRCELCQSARTSTCQPSLRPGGHACRPVKPVSMLSRGAHFAGYRIEAVAGGGMGIVYVAGDFKDKVLGRGTLVYVTNVSAGSQPGEIKITAKRITLYTTTGSLTGTGSGTQVNGSDPATTPTTVKDGQFNLTKGTGTLKGHSLKGTFDGPYKDGVYTFNYKATYK